MKNAIVLVSVIATAWAMTIMAFATCDGIYDGTEAEFKAIISGMSTVNCPDATRNGNPWLDSRSDRSIFDTSIPERPFFKYRFYKGKYIPQKYSHLVDEKIESDCNN